MRTPTTVLAILLTLAATAPNLHAQSTHVASQAALDAAIQQKVDDTAAQRDAVLRVLDRDEVKAVAGIRGESIREAAISALYGFVNPLSGGPDGAGWPFGRTLNDGDIHALLRAIPGVATVGRVYFFLADLRTGAVRDQELQRVALPQDAWLMSYQHQVVVDP